jgi:glycosyltransferase involved in cell wall biosynthesis
LRIERHRIVITVKRMSALPRISVVTPSFNSIHTIRETVESVREQNYPAVEHIVMDGGSKDGTVELLKEYPHLRWASEKDEGHYHAMNKGIQASTGEVIQILNSDDCLRPGALGAVGQAFAEHPDWDGLFGDIVFVDEKNAEIYRREEAVWDYDVLRFSGVGYVVHPALFVRKSVYDRLGLYRYTDFLNCCDGDFLLRMGKAGCRIGHVSALLVNYRYHPYGQSADLRVTQNTEREWSLIRQAHGAPGKGWRDSALRVIYRGKRQWQKLVHRGKIDLVPGRWKLRRIMRAKTNFTSNIDMAKFDAGQS